MEFLPFFVILVASVLFSLAFRRFHLPWVLALISAGIVVGEYGFGWVESNPTIDFIGQVGLILLMFMAGLETNLSSFKQFGKDIAWLSILNATIPFAVGFGIAWVFGFGILSALMLGIIFMSSSIAVIIPTLESTGVINTKLGRSIVSATVIEDVASLILLSIVLQTIDPITALPLPSFYAILAVILVSFRYGLPKIRSMIPVRRDEKDLFESEVRVVVALLVGVVVTFELLGLHPIIAGFFAGLVLSESIKSEILIDKLRTISYGIFIPTFFVLIGMRTDVTVFVSSMTTLGLVLTVIAGSIISKFGSGWFAARINGFTHADSLSVGAATIPQLSTTLAVVFTAEEFGLLSSELVAAMVVLSIITTMLAPIILRSLHPQTT